MKRPTRPFRRAPTVPRSPFPLPLLFLLLAACGEAPGGAPAVGRPAPEFAAVALEGARPVSLKELRGRPVLLNVWATWCHPCRQEIPALQKIHQTRRGLAVVGVSIDEPDQDDEIRTFLRRYGATYPVWLDPDDRVSSTFATVGVPTTFLIGADGTLLWKHVGPVSAEDPVLARALDTALGSHGGTEAQR